MGRKRIPLQVDERLGKPINCRFPRGVEAAIRALAEAQEMHAQDVIRQLAMEALALHSGRRGVELEAARRAGEVSGYAEAHNKWRTALNYALNHAPPDAP